MAPEYDAARTAGAVKSNESEDDAGEAARSTCCDHEK
jgi:hypothetical protein